MRRKELLEDVFFYLSFIDETNSFGWEIEQFLWTEKQILYREYLAILRFTNQFKLARRIQKGRDNLHVITPQGKLYLNLVRKHENFLIAWQKWINMLPEKKWYEDGSRMPKVQNY